jgi:hypothetical protein
MIPSAFLHKLEGREHSTLQVIDFIHLTILESETIEYPMSFLQNGVPKV